MKEDKSTLLGRREFLGTLTVAAAGALPAAAQAAGEKEAESPVALKIVDFHTTMSVRIFLSPRSPRLRLRCNRIGRASIAIWPIRAPCYRQSSKRASPRASSTRRPPSSKMPMAMSLPR